MTSLVCTTEDINAQFVQKSATYDELCVSPTESLNSDNEPTKSNSAPTPTIELWQTDSPALTDPKYAQYCESPVRYPKLVELYDEQESILWTEKEILFNEDINQFKAGLFTDHKRDERVKKMLLYVAGFFLFADGLIGLSLNTLVMPKITVREIINIYTIQSYIEVVHNKFYSIMIQNLYPGKLEEIQANLPSYDGIKRKVEWVERWVNTSHAIHKMTVVARSVQHMIVANVIVESVFLTPSFGIIYYIKRYGKLPAVSAGNDLISRDENLHRKQACAIYKLVEPEYRIPQKHVHAMIREAVEAEKVFISEAMDHSNIEGFPLDDAMKYPEYIGDLLAFDLGYEKIYNTPNPFTWMLTISLEPRKNFFEVTVTEYQNAITAKAMKKREDGFDFTEDPNF